MNRYFAFSIHKAGSTLFYSLIQQIEFHSNRLNRPHAVRYFSISDHLIKNGTPEIVLENENFLEEYKYDINKRQVVYGGFRFVPGFFQFEMLKNSKVMYLIRDPRDVLTSHYFSIKKSHRIPVGEAGEKMLQMRNYVNTLGIDDFVIEQATKGKWKKRFEAFVDLEPYCKYWRYEDVVFDKLSWFEEMLEFLEIDLPEGLKIAIVDQTDIIPTKEDESKHIRQVKPGDHARKLTPETIDILDEVFQDVLLHFGYS